MSEMVLFKMAVGKNLFSHRVKKLRCYEPKKLPPDLIPAKENASKLRGMQRWQRKGTGATGVPRAHHP